MGKHVIYHPKLLGWKELLRNTQVEQTGNVSGKLGNMGTLAGKKIAVSQELTWLEWALPWVRMLRQEVQWNCINCQAECFSQALSQAWKIWGAFCHLFFPQFIALHKPLLYYLLSTSFEGMEWILNSCWLVKIRLECDWQYLGVSPGIVG